MSSLHTLPRSFSYEKVTRQVDELVEGMTPEQSGKLSSTAFWGIGDALQIAKETHASFSPGTRCSRFGGPRRSLKTMCSISVLIWSAAMSSHEAT